ncbi:50S ribosomal protein L13 [Candidatus Peregrinibacteria bacterium]|nr:50S ribosomal protein L13 [Candidatus Peregrinibacteria bacterium]
MTRTFIPKVPTSADRKWFVVDAEGKTLGHIATKIADTLRGKNKATYTPHIDMGDYVVVINAEKVALTGNKEEQKEHIHHTHYWGHLRRAPISRVRATHPTRIIEQAVAGMIHDNRLKAFIIKRLKVYAGAEHPHVEKKLIPLSI